MRLEWWAMALTAACGSASAQPLGTLLHSAIERAKIDAPPAPAVRPRHSAVVEPPSVTGFVARSDGRATVFLEAGPPLHVAAPALSSECPGYSAAVSGLQPVADSRHCEPSRRPEGVSP